MKRLVAVLVVLAALVAVLLWLSRRSQGTAPLAMDAPSAATTLAETTRLAPNEKEAEAARQLVDEHAPTIGIVSAKPTTSGPHARIFGRVVDERGVPIARADVRISCNKGPWSRTERLEPDKPADRRNERLSTSTDALGKFTFDAPVPTAALVSIEVTPSPLLRHVEIQCADFDGRMPITVGDNDIGDILVGDGCAVTGLVVDEAGKGIADASLITNIAEGEHRAVPVRSDSDGLFMIPNLAPGKRTLKASSAGRRPVSEMPLAIAAGEMKQIDAIVLAKGSTIAGFVVDESGQPVEHIGIRARSTHGNSSSSATSEAQGAFSITLSVDEPHTLSISRSEQWDGLADPNAAKIEYEPGRAGVRLVAKASRCVTFRVTSAADGSAIERFGLELRRKLPPGSTGSQNDVTIEDHPGGSVSRAADVATQELVIDAPGFAPIVADIVFDAGSTDTQTLALSPGGVIIGRVFIGDTPAPGARVALFRESWNPKDGPLVKRPGPGVFSNMRTDVGAYAGRERTDVAGANGQFRYDMLSTGTYALMIQAVNGAPDCVREIGVVGGRTTDLGEIHLSLGGTLRGQFRAPPEETPLGYMIAINAIDQDPSRTEIEARRLTIASTEGSFEFRGLAPATYVVQWIQPEKTNLVFSAGGEMQLPRVVVTAGHVSELVLDASNTSPCVVAVRVLRRGEPFAGAYIRAMTEVRNQPKLRSSVTIGITDAEGRVEGKIEGGLRSQLQAYEREKGPLLVESSEVLEAEPRGRVEREMRLETGSLVLVLPPELVPPEKGDITISLTNPKLTPRTIRVNTPGWQRSADRIEWKGSVIALGPVAAGTYSVRVSMHRYDADPVQPNTFAPSELRPVFATDIEVRADAETRIEVR